MRKTFARLIEKWAKLINKRLSVYPQPLHNIFWCWFSSVIIFKFPRTAGYVFHAEHQQPGGGDEEEKAAEAGEEVATVQEQGFHFSSFCYCYCRLVVVVVIFVNVDVVVDVDVLKYILWRFCNNESWSGWSSWYGWDAQNLRRSSKKRGFFTS